MTENENKYTSGDHKRTLLLYFLVRTLFNLCTSVMWNISDGSATTIAVTQGSSYAFILFVGNIGGLLPNWIAGPLGKL